MSESSSAPHDLAPLIRRVRETLRGKPVQKMKATPAERLGEYRSRFSGERAERNVVLAEETAVELGSPHRVSVNITLWTGEPNLVEDGAVNLLGPDLGPGVREMDYAQVLMVSFPPEAPVNPFRLEAIPYLSHRLPGIMARVIPGRLWLRVSREALAEGADFSLIASALREAVQEETPGASVECVFVTAGREEAEKFLGLASETKILTGQHKKIALGSDGAYECEELECDSCSEKVVCDRIREVAVIRRRQKAGK